MKDLNVRFFPNLKQNFFNDDYIIEGAMLTTQNERLSLLNNIIGSFISGTTKTFLSANSVEGAKFNEFQHPTELNLLQGAASVPDYRFELSSEFIIMLLQYLQPRMVM